MRKFMPLALAALLCACAPATEKVSGTFVTDRENIPFKANVSDASVAVRFYEGRDSYLCSKLLEDNRLAVSSDCDATVAFPAGMDWQLAPPPSVPFRWLAHEDPAEFFTFNKDGSIKDRRFRNLSFTQENNGRGEHIGESWFWHENGWKLEFAPRQFIVRDATGKTRSIFRKD